MCTCTKLKWLQNTWPRLHDIESLLPQSHGRVVVNKSKNMIVFYGLMNIRLVKTLLPQARSRIPMKVKGVKLLLPQSCTPPVEKKWILNGCRTCAPAVKKKMNNNGFKTSVPAVLHSLSGKKWILNGCKTIAPAVPKCNHNETPGFSSWIIEQGIFMCSTLVSSIHFIMRYIYA